MPSPTDHILHEWRGRDVLDADGEKIGTVEDLYVDDATGEPEFVLVRSGLFGTRRRFVPVRGSTRAGDDAIQVAFARELVQTAPGLDADDDLSPEEEGRLYSHYGMDHASIDPSVVRLRRVVIVETRS